MQLEIMPPLPAQPPRNDLLLIGEKKIAPRILTARIKNAQFPTIPNIRSVTKGANHVIAFAQELTQDALQHVFLLRNEKKRSKEESRVY